MLKNKEDHCQRERERERERERDFSLKMNKVNANHSVSHKDRLLHIMPGRVPLWKSCYKCNRISVILNLLPKGRRLPENLSHCAVLG